MAEPRRLTDLAESAGAKADLPPGDLVVALSGGADSAALLWLCRRLHRSVRAVHVHHGLAASDRLAAAASAVAQAVDVPVAVEAVEIPPGSSPENQARRVRYEALLAAAAEGQWVLTAHTSDDQAETVLDHLLRGSGLDGLRGIPPRRFPFARPLLSVSRSTTREIASLAGLPWEDDPVNLAPDPLRNRIRTRLLPELEQYNRRIRDALAATARLAARDADYLEGAASVPVQATGEGAAMPASVLTTAHPAVAVRMIRRLLAAGGLEHTPRHAVGEVMAVARGETEACQPGGGLTVRRRGAMLVAESDVSSLPSPVDLEMPGETRFGEWILHAYLSDTTPSAMPLSAGWMVADADRVGELRVEPAVDHPTALRHLGGAGMRATDRERHPVVVADQGPIWVPGIRRLPIGWADSATRRYLVIRSGTERRWQR